MVLLVADKQPAKWNSLIILTHYQTISMYIRSLTNYIFLGCKGTGRVLEEKKVGNKFCK